MREHIEALFDGSFVFTFYLHLVSQSYARLSFLATCVKESRFPAIAETPPYSLLYYIRSVPRNGRYFDD